MRFHHSTRRGRNRLGQYSQASHAGGTRSGARHPTSTSRWTQLGYCRETNIHFNRRLPIEPPPLSELQDSKHSTSSRSINNLIDHSNNTHTTAAAAAEQASQQQQQELVDQLLDIGRMAETEATSPNNASNSPDSGASVGLSLDEHQQLGAGLDRLALADLPSSQSLITTTTRQRKQDRLPPAAVEISQHQHQSAPCKPKALQVSETEQQDGKEASSLDMESARQKLVAQVEKHPFWSKKAARRMQLTGLSERRIFLYELVSFCERRDLEWRFEPYRGGLVPSIPFRSSGGTGPASGAQTGLPGDSQMGAGATRSRSIRVPLPPTKPSGSSSKNQFFQFQSQSGDSLVWSSLTGGSDHRHPSTGGNTISPMGTSGTNRNPPVRRSRSSANSPTATILGTPGITNSIEPASSIECKIPGADYVWSIEAPAHLKPEPFVGQLHSCELPGSSFVKRCHGCQGRGRIKCASCYGVGYEVCISCSGKGTTRNHAALGGGSRINDRCDSHSSRNATSANGYDDDDGDLNYRGSSGGGNHRGNEPGGITGGSGGGVTSGAWVTESCHFCHGAGQKRCWVCAGKSYNHCQGCLGLGQLRCYLNLNITWTNHRDESILNNSDQIIPKERLRLCSGTMLLAEESQPKLRTLVRAQIDGATGSAEDSNQLHLASKRLLDKHQQSYRNERFIRQRHKVTQIQCHVVNYEWKHRRGHFVIYGDERKVYIAKYPFKSICNIT